MSRTIEAIMARTEAAKRNSTSASSRLLSANWQNGLEAGTQVQRKLRFSLTNLAAPQLAR